MVDLQEQSIKIAIGYIVSWVYVLLVLSFFQTMFGKTKGLLVAYGSSFLVWYAVHYGLNQRETAYN